MLFLRYYLWLVPHVLLGIVVIVSLRKRLYQTLPAFFAFAVFQLVQFLVLFTVTKFVTPSSIHIYVWLLTCGALIGALLQLAVLYELVRTVILSRTSLQRVLRLLFAFALAILVLASAATSGSLRDVGRERIMNGFEILDFSNNLVLAGMLVVILLFSRALNISWRSRATGVALGFGTSACIGLAAAAVRSGLGESAFVGVDVMQMAAFHVSVVIWIVYLFLPDRTPAFAGSGLAKPEIQFWEQELQRMTGQ